MQTNTLLRVIAAVALTAAVGCGCQKSAGTGPSHPSGGTATSEPPGGLSAEQVPQFVHFGFDDNGISGRKGSGTTGAMAFAVDLFANKKNPPGNGNAGTYDGSPARCSFYMATSYIAEKDVDEPENVKLAWRAALDAGHEIGIHTHNHPHGTPFKPEQWAKEIETCRSWLTKPFDQAKAAEPETGIGVPADQLFGFRAPFLEFSNSLFVALREQRVTYDCSAQEGFEKPWDGTNFVWPYRIERGKEGPGANQPELWEIPVYVALVPPDDECGAYGVQPGLRDKLKKAVDYFDPADGKITGFDWNLWVEFGMTGKEFVATLKYTLDLRLSGNRAPLTFGTHADIYSEQYYGETPNTTGAEREQALAEVLDYALSKPEVRVVSAKQILDWIKAPVAL